MGGVSFSHTRPGTASNRFLSRIETKVGLWRKGTESESWLDGADWVVDAIDNINTKVGHSPDCIDGNELIFLTLVRLSCLRTATIMDSRCAAVMDRYISG